MPVRFALHPAQIGFALTMTSTIPRMAERRRHFLALDGLRGVAAVSVLLFHCQAAVPGLHVFDSAYLAVDFFFLLSGFVIDYAYAGRLDDGLTALRFAKIRAVRLYPLIVCGASLGALAVVVERQLLGSAQWSDLVGYPFAMLALPVPSVIAMSRSCSTHRRGRCSLN